MIWLLHMRHHVIPMIVLLVFLGGGCVSRPDVMSETKRDLSGRGMTEVSQDVFTQTELVELDLSNNRLDGALPAEIRQLSQLEVLDASDNVMTGLPAEIGQLKNLKTLDVSNNQLTGLPRELGQLEKLEILDLRGNAISASDLGLLQNDLPNAQILTDDGGL